MSETNDGRFIDPETGTLLGEGAGQETGQAIDLSVGVSRRLPTSYYTSKDGPTYYNQPVLQTPVWIWTVPVYFYAGGTAGAALTLAGAAQLFGGGRLDGLVQACEWIGAAGLTAGSALLIADLGKPSRFLNMMRVFRPTSPLNLGSWLLGGGASAAGVAAVFGRAAEPLRSLGRLAGFTAGLLGIPLTGYTGVVLSNTVIPAWHDARREWPVLFVASSMTGAASLLDILDLSRREHRVVRTFGLLGKAAEAVSARCVERRIAQVPATAHPFRRGRASLLWRAAQLLGIASLVTALLPRQTRKKRIASAVMGTASSLCVRFASLEIGMASSQNPCAAFGQQRSGYGAFEKTRIAAVVGAGEERACRASDSRMAERIR
jgi:formate-dependent nitrite reductase membrane component NrfD